MFYYSRRFFTKKQIKKLTLVLITSLIVQHSMHSPFVRQAEAAEINQVQESGLTISAPDGLDKGIKTVDKKIVHKKIEQDSRIRTVSAYNAGDIYQTDGDPCIAANGEDICKALALGYKRCAANFVPFGTILEIEGWGECMVVDRMNSRYPQNVDIAMSYDQKPEALKFGRRKLTVKIIKLIKLDKSL